MENQPAHATNPDNTQRMYYPELYDRPHNETGQVKFILTCTRSFIKGKCESGHVFAKSLVCGKEWCGECGEHNSYIHKRRVARWYSKTMQFKKMGYLVVTVPEQLRDSYRDKKILSEFRTYVKRKLQRMGYDKGLIRYHWAGDCATCKGKGCLKCENTGAGRIWKPHLNVVIEQGYMSKTVFNEKFKTFKNDVGIWFRKKFPAIAKNHQLKGMCFFSYANDEAHKVHKLKYITRSTWRFYDREICNLLKGYRTTSTWGTFQKCDVKRTSTLVSFENSECPCCGEAIKWKKEFIRVEVFRKMSYQHVDGGYFILNSS